MPKLLLIQDTSNTTVHGRSGINTSTNVEAIPQYGLVVCCNNVNQTGTTTYQITNKILHCYICCFVTKTVHTEVVTSLSTEAIVATLRSFTAGPAKIKTIYSKNDTNFKVLLMNVMKSTRWFNPHHRRQRYNTSRVLKVAKGNSSHHMDRTSEFYGKQQWNPWSIICKEI